MDARNKILIVDDDPVNLDFFQLMLSKLGFTVGEACDGLDALEKMKDFYPDIILLDNVMPRMSGWELTKALKADENYRDIPIIMFSALDDVKDKVAGFDLGVDDYITKPFNFSEVLARIRAILRTRELFTQITARESRLSLAEQLSSDMRQNLIDLTDGIDELDSAVAAMSSWIDASGSGAPSGLSSDIKSKTGKIRGIVEDLNSRIGRTILEWNDLKKNEIGLSALEDDARKPVRQEQQ